MNSLVRWLIRARIARFLWTAALNVGLLWILLIAVRILQP